MRSRLFYLLPLFLLPSLAAAFSSSTSGNQTTFGGFTATPSNVSGYTLSTATDGRVLVKSPVRIPLAGGGSFPIDVTGGITKPNAAAAIGRFLLKGSGVIGVLGLGVAAYELAQELGFGVDNSSGDTTATKPITGACTVGPCYEYRLNSNNFPTYYRTREQACQTAVQTIAGYIYIGVDGVSCRYKSSAAAVTSTFDSIVQRTRSPDTTLTQPATIADIQAAIEAQNVWNPNSALGRAVRDAIGAGDTLPVPAPVVTGPASVPGATSTTVDEATGETTTVTQTVNNTYNGPNVTTSVVTTTVVTNTSTGAPIRQSTTTTNPVVELPVSPDSESLPFAMPCGVAGTPPCGVKVDESQTPTEVPADEFKPLLDEGKQAQEDLLEQVKSDADKSFFEPFTDLFVTPALAECVPLEIPGDRGTIDPCGTVGGARAIMAYIWALSGLALCLHMVRSAL